MIYTLGSVMKCGSRVSSDAYVYAILQCRPYICMYVLFRVEFGVYMRGVGPKVAIAGGWARVVWELIVGVVRFGGGNLYLWNRMSFLFRLSILGFSKQVLIENYVEVFLYNFQFFKIMYQNLNEDLKILFKKLFFFIWHSEIVTVSEVIIQLT